MNILVQIYIVLEVISQSNIVLCILFWNGSFKNSCVQRRHLCVRPLVSPESSRKDNDELDKAPSLTISSTFRFQNYFFEASKIVKAKLISHLKHSK